LLCDCFVAFGHERPGLGSEFLIRIIKTTKSEFRNTALMVRYDRVVLGGRGEVAGDGHGQSPAAPAGPQPGLSHHAGGNRHAPTRSINQLLDSSVGDPGHFGADPWIRTYL
jgi:hypothetical protein